MFRIVRVHANTTQQSFVCCAFRKGKCISMNFTDCISIGNWTQLDRSSRPSRNTSRMLSSRSVCNSQSLKMHKNPTLIIVVVWCSHQSRWPPYTSAMATTSSNSSPTDCDIVRGADASTPSTTLDIAKSNDRVGKPRLTLSRERAMRAERGLVNPRRWLAMCVMN